MLRNGSVLITCEVRWSRDPPPEARSRSSIGATTGVLGRVVLVVTSNARIGSHCKPIPK
jgi:hypothetical protein